MLKLPSGTYTIFIPSAGRIQVEPITGAVGKVKVGVDVNVGVKVGLGTSVGDNVGVKAGLGTRVGVNVGIGVGSAVTAGTHAAINNTSVKTSTLFFIIAIAYSSISRLPSSLPTANSSVSARGVMNKSPLSPWNNCPRSASKQVRAWRPRYLNAWYSGSKWHQAGFGIKKTRGGP